MGSQDHFLILILAIESFFLFDLSIKMLGNENESRKLTKKW